VFPPYAHAERHVHAGPGRTSAGLVTAPRGARSVRRLADG